MKQLEIIMAHCLFCRNKTGKLIYDHLSETSFHIDCLIQHRIAKEPCAEKIAFFLGIDIKEGATVEGNLIAKAQRIYYDAGLSVGEAISLGMLEKRSLIHGEFYVGYSKYGQGGIWDEKEQCFHFFDKIYYKFGYFFRGRFDDSFIPIL